MLRTVIHQVAAKSSGAAPKLIASRVLGPAIMANSARYAGSSKYWFSTHEKKNDAFQDIVAEAAHSKKTFEDNRFVGDHAFDPGEDYEKAMNLMKQAAEKKTALGGHPVKSPLVLEQPTAEELQEIDLEHNEFITDHTFDVNDEKIQKQP